MLVLRFTVREFYYDEKEIKREREELSRLLSDKKQQYVSRLRGGRTPGKGGSSLGAHGPGNVCPPGAAGVRLGKAEGPRGGA